MAWTHRLTATHPCGGCAFALDGAPTPPVAPCWSPRRRGPDGAAQPPQRPRRLPWSPATDVVPPAPGGTKPPRRPPLPPRPTPTPRPTYRHGRALACSRRRLQRVRAARRRRAPTPPAGTRHGGTTPPRPPRAAAAAAAATPPPAAERRRGRRPRRPPRQPSPLQPLLHGRLALRAQAALVPARRQPPLAAAGAPPLVGAPRPGGVGGGALLAAAG